MPLRLSLVVLVLAKFEPLLACALAFPLGAVSLHMYGQLHLSRAFSVASLVFVLFSLGSPPAQQVPLILY